VALTAGALTSGLYRTMGKQSMRLFDSHCHLQDERIIAKAEAIIGRARSAGVTRMLCCGTQEADWEAVRALAANYPEIIPGFGLHPWFIGARSGDWLSKLETLLTSTPSAAVAEIGLDHALDEKNYEEQGSVFIAQVKLARKLKRPLSIHCRKAWGDLVRIVKQQCGLPDGGVIHSYSGPPDLIPELESLNASFSFSGSITYDRNLRGRASAAAVSEGRLLLETDSPDIPPLGVEQGANEPAKLVAIARTLAGIRGKNVEEIGEIAYNNAARIFERDPGTYPITPA
jgi:TatD DNase family protein